MRDPCPTSAGLWGSSCGQPWLSCVGAGLPSTPRHLNAEWLRCVTNTRWHSHKPLCHGSLFRKRRHELSPPLGCQENRGQASRRARQRGAAAGSQLAALTRVGVLRREELGNCAH